MKIIAEIGLNHCGSEKLAEEMLEALLQTSIDTITFQIREKEYYDGSKPWRNRLSDKFYAKAIALAHKKGKEIGFAVSDPLMVDLLEKSGADIWKTLSKDIGNKELFAKLKATKKEIYMSTGLSALEEVKQAAASLDNPIIIHTQLSNELGDVNLSAIPLLREATQKEVAFGLHCSDHNVLYVSLGFRPAAIFFYVKKELAENLPDNAHALLIADVEHVARELKELTKTMGTGKKEKMGRKV